MNLPRWCCCSDRYKRSQAPQRDARQKERRFYELLAIAKFDVTDGLLQTVGGVLESQVSEVWKQVKKDADRTLGPNILISRGEISGSRDRKYAVSPITGVNYPVPSQFAWSFLIPMSVDLFELSDAIKAKISESIPASVAVLALSVEETSIKIVDDSNMELSVLFKHVTGIGNIVDSQIQAQLNEVLPSIATQSEGVVIAGTPKTSMSSALSSSDLLYVIPLSVKLQTLSQRIEDEIGKQAQEALPNVHSLLTGLVVSLDSVTVEHMHS